MEIKFTQDQIDQCTQFAEEIDTSYYASRNQESDSKRKKDQIVGKLGEIAVYTYLKDKYPSISYPDFKIYDKKDKSWDFDMKGENINLHCKSQELKMSKKFGESWTFQRGDGHSKNYDLEIFDKKTPHQYVAFVIVDLQNNAATIKAIVELDFIHKKDLFKLPIMAKLRENNKSVVYFREMKEYTTKLWAL
jgi:hypothetical protein